MSVFSQTPTPADRERAIEYLESTKKGVVEAPVFLRRNGISSPPPEHIAAAEDFLMGMVTGQVMNRPRGPLAMM